MPTLASTPLIRRFAALLSIALLAAIGIGASSASAHTFSASGKCGTASLNWVSFAGSGSKPANKPDWNIVKDSASPSLASGQYSFTGSSGSLDVPIPSTNGSYVASSSWTAANTRDGNVGSGSSNFKLSNCDQISTTASPSVVLGGDISDTAHLSGATNNAGGTIKFQLYSNSDPTCKTPLATSSTPVSGNGDYTSASVKPAYATGYQWTATYSGDNNNGALGPHGCGVAAEQVTVTSPPPVVPPTTPPNTPVVPPTTPVAKHNHKHQHQGVKSACQVGPGHLDLTGPGGNVRKSFKVSVKSSGFSRVTIFVDGKKMDTRKQSSIHTATFNFHVNARSLKPGVHKVMVVGGAGPRKCGTTQRSLHFVRAKPAAAAPEFTG